MENIEAIVTLIKALLPNIPLYDATISASTFATMAAVMNRLPKSLAKKLSKLSKFILVLIIGTGYGYVYNQNGVVGFEELHIALLTGLFTAFITSGLRDGGKNMLSSKKTVINHNNIAGLNH